MHSSVLKVTLLISLAINLFSYSPLAISAAESGANAEDSKNIKSTLLKHIPALNLGNLLTQDLKRYIPEHNIEILKTSNDTPFVALLKEETTGLPKGISFIIPDINQPILRQAATNALYKNLDVHGWSSLVLTMPFLDDITQNNLIINSDTGNASLNDAATKNIEADPNAIVINNYELPPAYNDELNNQVKEEIGLRLSAGFEFSKSMPGFYLIICEGKSCFWINQLIAEQSIPMPDAMIMLSAHMPQQDLNKQFAEAISITDFPVLDLYLNNDSAWVNTTISWRKKMARKNFKTNYRQRQLNGSYSYQGQQVRTLKEILGFIKAVGL